MNLMISVLMLAMVSLTLMGVVPASAQCTDGSGCTCEQCGASGYGYFCQATGSCYDTELTCSSTFDGDCDSCVATTSCVPQAFCNASSAAMCGSGETCCIDGNTYQPFCAAGADVTCCNYGQMVCPNRMTCDPPTGQCVTPNPNSTSCSICQEVVGQLESKGCDEACDFLPPPFDAVCGFLMDNAGLCTYLTNLIQGGFTPRHVCEMISACGGGSCECGYCTPSVFGQLCLSVPNDCPSGMHASNVSRVTAEARRKSREDVPATADFIKQTWRVPKEPKKVTGAAKSQDVCVDGTCAAEYAGCCLTCAP